MRQIKTERELIGKTLSRIVYTRWGVVVLYFVDNTYAVFIPTIREDSRLFKRDCSPLDFTVAEEWK